MKNILYNLSNWRVILPLFILFLTFPIIWFPNQEQRMAQLAGQEIIPLDARFSYSYNEVKNDFEKLGEDGRKTYRFAIGVLDMIFPMVYGPLFILVLAWLLKKLKGKDSHWMFLALFPCIGILFEYLENFNTLSLLDRYPGIKEEAVAWGEQMTRLKHIFLLLSLFIMALLAIMLIIRSLKRRNTPSSPSSVK